MIVPVEQPYEVANCLTARMHKGINSTLDEGQTPVVSHSLRGEGFDASEDGTGRGTPPVPVGVTIHGTDPTVRKVASYDDVAQCLRARTPGNIDNSSTTVIMQGVVGSLSCNTGPNGHDAGNFACNQAVDAGHVVPVAYAVSLRGRDGGGTAELGDEVGNCLRASGGGGDKAHVMAATQVRRLTPTECERLQGFPDDYTQVPHRNKPAADGPRYKALGNSWAVPVVHWIGRRIDAVEAIHAQKAREAA